VTVVTNIHIPNRIRIIEVIKSSLRSDFFSIIVFYRKDAETQGKEVKKSRRAEEQKSRR